MPGKPLEAGTRTFMESRFDHDFSRVRVHTGAEAARSAQAAQARAYTLGRDVVFGEGQYQTNSGPGLRLMAHELAHVVQQEQEQAGQSTDAEARAQAVSGRVMHGQPVTKAMIGGAAPGLYADNGEEETTTPAPAAATTRPAFSLGWTDMARLGMFTLTPPELRLSPPSRPSLGAPTLSSPASPSGVPALPPPSLLPTPTTLPTPALTPPSPTTSGPGPSAAPELPSRLPLLNRGRFSLGLSLGFPKPEEIKVPGAPPSGLQQSLQRAKILNQTLTGKVPSGWEAVDKVKLAKAIWGIFSENIAPDLARSITSGLSAPAGPAGTSYELDLVLLTDFSSEIGGGLSFTIRF